MCWLCLTCTCVGHWCVACCRMGSSSLGSALRCEDAGFVSFLSSTLALDPAVRADADTAAAHEWMTLHPHRPQVIPPTLPLAMRG